MADEPVNYRLGQTLSGMSEKDCQYLILLLAQPDGARLLSGALESRLAARQGKRTHWTGWPTPTQRRQRERLHLLLDDQRRFPTMTQAVEAVHRAFGFQANRDEFKRRGRRDLATCCWARLKQLPCKQIDQKLAEFARLCEALDAPAA